MKKLLIKFYMFIRHKILNVDDRSDVQIAVDNGMTVGKHFQCKQGCILDPGHVWLITIGDEVTLAPRVHILTHDASTKKNIGYTKIAPVKIGNNVFIGANSTILPGVSIGNNVIIGANSLVSKDVPSDSLCVGNPACVIGSVSDFCDKHRQLLKEKPVYDASYMITNITDEKKKQMKKDLEENKFGYIV